MKVKSTTNFSNASICKSPMLSIKCLFENSLIHSMQLTLLEFQVFQTKFSNQKIPQNDNSKKNLLIFLNKSILTSSIQLGWFF